MAPRGRRSLSRHAHNTQSDRNVQRYRGDSTQDLISELGFGGIRVPRVEVTEEDNKYVVHAEVPGVRKEDLDVSVGDGGRTLRIQGGTSSSTSAPETKAQEPPVTSNAASTSEAPAQEPKATETRTDVTPSTVTYNDQVAETPAQPLRQSTFTFSRTIRLPWAVDPTKITAKLDHGILTLQVPKTEEVGVQKIQIE